MPVSEEVYGKFLLDPSVASRYVEFVAEYELYRKTNPEAIPFDKIDAGTAPVFAPVAEVIVPKTVVNSLDFQLRPTESPVDVLIVVNGDTLSRVERDEQRVAPPATVYGLSKDFVLDALFQTTLTQRNPTQTIQSGLLQQAQLWIRSPKPGFAYGLKVEP